MAEKKQQFSSVLLVDYDRHILFGTHVSYSLTVVIIIVVIILTECGEVLTASKGIIKSPGYPNIYPSGVNCTWHIVAQQGQLIRLVFDSFYLDFHYNCTNDYLEIYDVVDQISLGR